MQATKSSNPRRQESRNSAAPNECQQDIQQAKILCLATNLLHHGPQHRIQKTSRNMAARKRPRLYVDASLQSRRFEAGRGLGEARRGQVRPRRGMLRTQNVLAQVQSETHRDFELHI